MSRSHQGVEHRRWFSRENLTRKSPGKDSPQSPLDSPAVVDRRLVVTQMVWAEGSFRSETTAVASIKFGKHRKVEWRRH